MENGELSLQKLSYFTEGNTFTGSRTKDRENGVILRYLVKPDKENGRLLAYAWNRDVCFEKAPDRQEAAFSLDEEGLEETRSWLEGLYGSL